MALQTRLIMWQAQRSLCSTGSNIEIVLKEAKGCVAVLSAVGHKEGDFGCNPILTYDLRRWVLKLCAGMRPIRSVQC